MVTKCLTILLCGEAHLPHSRRDLVPSLTNNPSSRSKPPLPALPCPWGTVWSLFPAGAFRCWQELCAPAARGAEPHCQVRSRSYVLSLSAGRVHPARGAGVQHLHCSGHHTPPPLEAITCRLLPCPSVTSCATCPFRSPESRRGRAAASQRQRGLRGPSFDPSAPGTPLRGLRGQQPRSWAAFQRDSSLAIGHRARATILVI